MTTRSAFLVYIDLGPRSIPFHTEKTARDNLQCVLSDEIPQHNPVVTGASPNMTVYSEWRKAFLVYVDMPEDSPDAWYSTHNIIRQALLGVMPHHNPVVSYVAYDFPPEPANDAHPRIPLAGMNNNEGQPQA